MKREESLRIGQVLRAACNELEHEEVLRHRDGYLDTKHAERLPATQGVDLEGSRGEQEVDDDRLTGVTALAQPDGVARCLGLGEIAA